jgi:prepilin-type N-terminal cleavage/methylation domain-containing protein
MKAFWRHRLPGFSLIEVSIVLLIIGIMLGAILKGRDFIEQAKIRVVVTDFARLQTIVMMYTVDRGAELFDDVTLVWKKLHAAELLSNDDPPESKLGGLFAVHNISGMYYLTLCSETTAHGAFLTKNQAAAIYTKLTDAKEINSAIIVQNTRGVVVDIKEETSTDERYTVSVRLQ